MNLHPRHLPSTINSVNPGATIMSKFTFTKAITAAIMTFSAAALVALPALAGNGQTSNCVIWDVGTDTNGTRLTLHCTNDSNHYTAGYSGCAATSVEQVKQWHSQAMAALLAGKKVSLWWNDSCGTRAMSGFVMTVQ
jgi:hypothetical protein